MGKVVTVLNERDIKIFELINKFGWIREDYLARYLGFTWGDIKVRGNMATLAYRLSKHGFIVKKKIIEGYPGYWALGKSGANFLGSAVERDITLMTLRHNDLVADLATDWLVKNKENEEFTLNTELELKRELFGAEAKKKKLPDLVIDGKIAVEVEISKKPDTRLATIIANYYASAYEQVIYYTNSKGIANRISQIAQNSSLFKFKFFEGVNINNAVEYMPAGGNSELKQNMNNNLGGSQVSGILDDIIAGVKQN